MWLTVVVYTFSSDKKKTLFLSFNEIFDAIASFCSLFSLSYRLFKWFNDVFKAFDACVLALNWRATFGFDKKCEKVEKRSSFFAGYFLWHFSFWLRSTKRDLKRQNRHFNDFALWNGKPERRQSHAWRLISLFLSPLWFKPEAERPHLKSCFFQVGSNNALHRRVGFPGFSMCLRMSLKCTESNAAAAAAAAAATDKRRFNTHNYTLIWPETARNDTDREEITTSLLKNVILELLCGMN